MYYHQYFLDLNTDLSLAMPGSYDLFLVSLSYLAAVIAAFAAFNLADRVSDSAYAVSRQLWLGAGSIAMGSGVWAMHFIGMLAFTMPMPVDYDPMITLISMVPAILASAVAIHIISRPVISLRPLLIGGTFMGAGIGVMHYTGMAAMRMNAITLYHPGLFALSILVAVVLALIALYIKFIPLKKVNLNANWIKLGSALMMGLAISGMHYTAMSAAYFMPTGAHLSIEASHDPFWLAISISVIVFLIMIIAITATFVDHQLTVNRRLAVEIKMRKLAEEATLEREQRLRAMTESANAAIISADFEGIIISWNKGARAIFGYEVEEVLGKPLTILMSDRYRAMHLNGLERFNSTGVAHVVGKTVELHGLRKDGTEFPIELSLSTWKITVKTFFMGIIYDITERKNAERELIKAKEQAESASRAKQQFLASMSHELRTPLNAIIGYSELLKEDAEEQGLNTLTSDLEKIHSAGKHLLSLISDVLDLTKIDMGKMTLLAETFEVAQLVESVRTIAQPLAEQKGNTLTVKLAGDVGHMLTDPSRVRQCLLNLLSNAAKFTEKGQVSLDVTRQRKDDNEYIVFQVSDTGIGIVAEQKNRIFEAFTQAEVNTAAKYGGTGLGLAITRELAHLMGGDIGVESVFGEGSTFTLRLPVAQALKSSGEAQSLIDKRMTERINDDGTPLVLVIDDEVESREILIRYLIKDGYQVITASSGAEGIRLARELQPLAITLDVLMPGMDGWHVLEALKADRELADIPVIMCTIVDDKNKGFALDATEYLTKPIDRKRLLGVLDNYYTGSSCLALVVEDDAASRDMIVRTLTRRGWAVNVAENGRVALARLAEQKPNVILLDLMMPEMDGFEFIAELQRHEEWRGVPVMVVTAMELSANDHQRLNGYVETVLAKQQFTTGELLEEVAERLHTMVRKTNKPEAWSAQQLLSN